MMSSNNFTKAEKADSQKESFAVLVRFLWGMRVLRVVFVPYIILLFAACAMPQAFLWLTGEYSRCTDQNNCQIFVPYLNINLSLTLTFFVWFFVFCGFLRIFSWAIFEVTGQWAGRDLHAQMVNAVSKVRTTFFDENPSGRLINRLVRDYDNLRVTGIIRVSDTFHALSEVICGAALIFFVSPLAALLVLPTVAVFFHIQRQIAPMLHKCGTVRSTRFGEVLHRETDLIEGARTFQLYNKQKSLLRRLQFTLSRYIQLHMTLARIEAWGRFWTSMLTTVYGFISTLFVVYALNRGWVTEVLAAVILTAIFRLAPSFMWLSWVTAYLMESVAVARRVFEFVDLPRETSQEFAEKVKLTDLLVGNELRSELLSGDLKFENYSMSYRADSPLILKNLSLVFKAGQKIGVVGRTGAGKTSLVQSLYRMVHVHGGDIKIGNNSIFKFDIDFIRSHFAVVPQDPYLFQGTIRSNLDRGNVFAEAQLKKALEDVGLQFDLSARVEEGGKNYSLGERQLLCLARVIITKHPYIIMDEPTSGVDTITDARIQEVLSTTLAGKTVITIAHRLDTLQYYDWIIEMREGRLYRAGTASDMIQQIGALDLA